MSKPVTGAEISAIFDAIPESIVVRESLEYRELWGINRVVGESSRKEFYDWNRLQQLGRDAIEEGASGRMCGDVAIIENPISLLFGRNGSGKTRFLEAVAELPSGRRSLLGASVKFRFPSQDLYNEWRTSAVSAIKSEWLARKVAESWPVEDFGPPPEDVASTELLHIFGLSIVDDVRESLLRDPSTPSHGFWGTDHKTHLEWVGFSDEVISAWGERDLHRWGPGRTPDDSLALRPYAFLDSPPVRSLAPEYYLQYASRVPSINHEGPHESYGDVWSSTQDWMDSSALSGLIGPAVEEFLARFTHVEYISNGYFRLLADQEEVPAVMAYIAAAKSFYDNQYKRYFSGSGESVGHELKTSLPLDMFRLQNGGPMVESVLIPSAARGRHPLIDVLNLMPEDASATGVESLLAELAGRNLRVSVHPGDEGDDDLIVLVRGYDILRRVSEEVSKIAARCDCGIEDVRISGFDQAGTGWLRSITETGSHYRYLGREVFNAVPPAKIEWKDKNSGDWLEFGDASLGQRQILMILFSVHLLVESDARSPLTIVVGDEIDKNLHWTASSSLFRELAEWLSATKGIFVIFSTHTVPALGSPGMSGINRIFARREGKAFSFLPSRDADELIVAETLGVNGIDAWRFADLLLVVEGDHDELVFGSKIFDSHPSGDRIQVINGGGLYAWGGILNNVLQHLNAPILFVYDKRNDRLEVEWERIHESLQNNKPLPHWSQTDLARLHEEICARIKNREFVPGDDEAQRILWMLENNVFEPRAPGLRRLQPNATLARRIHVHGIDVDDVVDLLPINLFPGAKSFSSWEDAHHQYPNGKTFKAKLDITQKSIASALKRDDGRKLHPEIQRLVHRIIGLIPGAIPLN